MVSLTATLFKNIMGDDDIDDEDAEDIIDLAVSKINLYGINVDLPLMGGTPGSKTLSLETREYAAVMIAARAIYYASYIGVENVNEAGLAVNSPDLESNPVVQAAIEKAARLLSDLDIDYG